MQTTVTNVSVETITITTATSQETQFLKEICQAFLNQGLNPPERNVLAQQIVNALSS